MYMVLMVCYPDAYESELNHIYMHLLPSIVYTRIMHGIMNYTFKVKSSLQSSDMQSEDTGKEKYHK